MTDLHVKNAIAAWAEQLPDWVRVLADRADEIGLKKTAAQVGYSAASITYVIRRKYNAPLDKIETRVRATLMAATVHCPELGKLSLAQCLDWREKEKDFKATSSLRTRMMNACRQCPINATKGG
jgi:hypothetical protein